MFARRKGLESDVGAAHLDFVKDEERADLVAATPQCAQELFRGLEDTALALYEK